MKAIQIVFLTFLTPIAINCNPCSAPREAARILQGQDHVTECGELSPAAPRARVDEIIDCMERAVLEQHAFRASTTAPRGVSSIALGRSVAGRYEVQMIGSDYERSFVDAHVCFGPPGFYGFAAPQSTVSYFTWRCPEENMRTEPLPPQPAYNPPSSVPIGRICPVM